MVTAAPASATEEHRYVLGHRDDELDRLIAQAQFFGTITEHTFQLAGITPGMRVLDVGCGAGDVSFLAARMVGPAGSVIGVDRSPEAVAHATERARSAGVQNVRFTVGDLTELELDEPVDAVVGRLVLMYLPDPAVALRHLATLVKPGGILVFNEFDLNGALSEPESPLFELAVARIKETFSRTGGDIRAGLRMGRMFEEAGLGTPQQLLSARVERGHDSSVYQQVTMITRTLLPMMIHTGVATAEEVDIDTFADRLRQEVVDLGTTIVSPSLVGAWTRTRT